MTSAYPLAHDVLVARVRKLATELGHAPSQRRVMNECSVGRERAKAALAEITAGSPQVNPPVDASRHTPDQGTDRAADTPAGRALHVVPDVADQPAREHSAPAESTAQTRSAAPEVLDTPAEPAVVPTRRPRVPRWPILVIALGAFVSIWGGWVGLGKLAGFGPVQLLPGIADEFVINSAITLPLGVEAYAFYALWVWLAPAAARVPARARRFACWSSAAALGVGLFGQATYHLLAAAGAQRAPDPVVVFVSCLPVLVLGAAAALAHLTHHADDTAGTDDTADDEEVTR
jgi:hypothetical protein